MVVTKTGEKFLLSHADLKNLDLLSSHFPKYLGKRRRVYIKLVQNTKTQFKTGFWPFLPAAKQRRSMGGKYKSEEEEDPGKFSSSSFDFRNSRNQRDRGHQNIGHRGCL